MLTGGIDAHGEALSLLLLYAGWLTQYPFSIASQCLNSLPSIFERGVIGLKGRLTLSSETICLLFDLVAPLGSNDSCEVKRLVALWTLSEERDTALVLMDELIRGSTNPLLFKTYCNLMMLSGSSERLVPLYEFVIQRDGPLLTHSLELARALVYSKDILASLNIWKEIDFTKRFEVCQIREITTYGVELFQLIANTNYKFEDSMVEAYRLQELFQCCSAGWRHMHFENKRKATMLPGPKSGKEQRWLDEVWLAQLTLPNTYCECEVSGRISQWLDAVRRLQLLDYQGIERDFGIRDVLNPSLFSQNPSAEIDINRNEEVFWSWSLFTVFLEARYKLEGIEAVSTSWEEMKEVVPKWFPNHECGTMGPRCNGSTHCLVTRMQRKVIKKALQWREYKYARHQTLILLENEGVLVRGKLFFMYCESLFGEQDYCSVILLHERYSNLFAQFGFHPRFSDAYALLRLHERAIAMILSKQRPV